MISNKDKNITNSSFNQQRNEIIMNLNKILNKMNNQFLLSQLAELIENETKGKFSFMTLRQILDKIYPKIDINDKQYLLKHISLNQLNISEKFPLISLVYLFTIFEKLLNQRILSPSLIYYKVAEILEKKLNISTIELIDKCNLTLESELNVNELYNSFSKRLYLDEIYNIVLFKGIDYKNKGRIRIEYLVLVIDSFRNNLIEENNEEEKIQKAKILKMFLDKNYISSDILYEGADLNFLHYDELKQRIMNQINISNNNFLEKEPINESTIDHVLVYLSKNDKIFKNDFENYFPNLDNKNNIIKKDIFLNDIQKIWIAKYLDMLSSVNITSKMAFDAAASKKDKNILNLEDLKKLLKIILPNGKISTEEANSIMDCFNINKNRIININQYDDIINQILNEVNDDNVMKNNYISNDDIKGNFMNTWTRGFKSTNFHKLPYKGNFEVLEKVRNDLEKSLSFGYNNKENINILNLNYENTINDENNNNEYIITLSDINSKKYINTTSDNKTEIKIKSQLEEYNEEFYLIEGLENFKYKNLFITSFDLFKFLVRDYNLQKERMSQFVKYIDYDLDGFINLLDIITFLLHSLKHRSTKLLLKYLYIIIYNDNKFNSTKKFFIANNIDSDDEIIVNELCQFLNKYKIEFPLSKKLYDEMKGIFHSPILYSNLEELINECKNEDIYYINSLDKEKPEIDMKYLEKEIRKIIYNFVDDDYYINTEYLRAKNFRDELKIILKQCENSMNINQYNLNFVKPLNIKPDISKIIFQLLSRISPEGEKLISKFDLITFLESYITENDNIIINNENDDPNKEIDIKNIIKDLEKNGPAIKYAFEKIPFSRNGYLTINEIKNTLNEFYNGILTKENLMIIISELDEKKTGMINYLQLEIFIYEYSTDIKNKFSSKLEMEFISSNIIKENYNNANDYFSQTKFKTQIKNPYTITRNEHNIILLDITSSNNNRNELYDLICKKEGKEKGYTLNYLCDWINNFIIESDDYEEKSESDISDNENISENLNNLPEKNLIEIAMNQINIGLKGKISLNEFYMKIPIENRVSLIKIFDKEKKGIMSYPNFINRLRELYGINIDLNYKLCAQYLYRDYIKNPKNVVNYILTKSECNNDDIYTYMTYDQVYYTFIFAFANDKFLFRSFYNIFKEKKGKWVNMINLSQFVKFLQMNNIELQGINLFNVNKESEMNLEEISENTEEEEEEEEEIDESGKDIQILLSKKLINIKDILDNINPKLSNIKNDYTIDENYLKTILNVKFSFTDNEIETFINYFKINEDRIDIKKIYNFDRSIKRDRDNYLSSEVNEKIKEQIKHSPFKSYIIYKKSIFQKNKLDLTEVSLLFQNLYNITLFGSLICMNNQSYLIIDKFFSENKLKDYFPEKEYDPTLKIALTRLFDYFQSHKDIIQLFQSYDSNNDGYLLNDEFITALNSFNELELNDNQKFQVLNLADKNKNSRINIYEFVSFIRKLKNINNSDSLLKRKNIKKNKLPNLKLMNSSTSLIFINNQLRLNEEVDEINIKNKHQSGKMPRINL